jgi:non-ribosomal peptide synthetase component F
MDAYAHQDVPFERLVEELHPARDYRVNPLFQVMFVFQPDSNQPGLNQPGLNQPGVAGPRGTTITPVDLPKAFAKFDLTLYVANSPAGLSVNWQYSTSLFDEARISRLAGHFTTLLAGILDRPDARLSALPLLDDAERQQMLVTWNRTALPYSRDRCFHQLFEEQARARPEALAVRCGDEQLSYRELNARADALARRLRELGVGPEAAVGILMPRSAGMVVALLGVMKAGGACVPLDPDYPPEHLAFIQADAGVTVVVTEQGPAGAAGSGAAPPGDVTPATSPTTPRRPRSSSG